MAVAPAPALASAFVVAPAPALAPPLVIAPALMAAPDLAVVAAVFPGPVAATGSLSRAGLAAANGAVAVVVPAVAAVPGTTGAGVLVAGIFSASGRGVPPHRVALPVIAGRLAGLAITAGAGPPGRRHRLGVAQTAVLFHAGLSPAGLSPNGVGHAGPGLSRSRIWLS